MTVEAKTAQPAKSFADDTPIEDVVGSPRAIKALKAKGINKVGDIRSMADVVSIPGVSAGVVAQLSELPIQKGKPAAKDSEIEEGEHPIVLRSRFPGFIIRLLGGDVIPAPLGMPGRPSIVQPIAVMFKGGAAELDRKMWLTVKHRRDIAKVESEMAHPAAEAPWRTEAVKWLRARATHRQGAFVVLE